MGFEPLNQFVMFHLMVFHDSKSKKTKLDLTTDFFRCRFLQQVVRNGNEITLMGSSTGSLAGAAATVS